MTLVELRSILAEVAAAELFLGELTTRQRRAIDIAAGGGLTPRSKGRWSVRSQRSDHEYRVCGDTCSCPDEWTCKHVLAVQIYQRSAELLSERLLEPRSWRNIAFRSPLAVIADMEQRYQEWLSVPPPVPKEGLLYSLGLEAIGDDAVAAERMCRRAGTRFGPRRTSHLRLERPWVARIAGLCPRYEFAREFQRWQKDYRNANKRGSRGVFVYYHLPPGLCEINELVAHGKSRRYFARIADLSLAEIEKGEVIQCLVGSHTVI